MEIFLQSFKFSFVKMSLTVWKELDECFSPPCRNQPCRHLHCCNEISLALEPRLIIRDFQRVERRVKDIQKKLFGNTSDLAIPTTDQNGFRVQVDVQQFTPEEITVKTNETSVIIEGKHEERRANESFISRKFTRKYALPPGYDTNTVTSELSSDGLLTIKAPNPIALASNERQVTIRQTGPAR